MTHFARQFGRSWREQNAGCTFSLLFRSFVAPAIAAQKAGRPQLAQDLLRHERNAGDRVMALLALHQWGPAVLAAELAHDCDLGAIVAIRLREAELAGELAGTAGKALSRCLDDRLVEGAGVVEILAGNLAGNEVDGAIALLAQIVETCPLSRHLVETLTVASSLLRCVIANPRGEFVPSAVKLLVRIQQGSHGSSSSS